MILRSIPRAQRMASIRGRIMIDTVRGVLRVRKWPKKRGPPKSALQRFWIDWFTQANLLAKYADAESQRRAIQMTKDTGLYPRDVLLSAMRGRLYTWADETGWKWYPMAALQDVSDALDILGQTIGDVLVRAVDRWRPAADASDGFVLTHKGPNDAPVWQLPSGGGGFLGGASVIKSDLQNCTNGSSIILTWDGELYDTDDIHDNAVNNSRLTVPPGFTKVRLNAAITWTINNTNGRILSFKKNGANFVGMSQHYKMARKESMDSIASGVIECIGGDYFEVRCFQDSGTSQKIVGTHDNTNFSMELVE